MCNIKICKKCNCEKDLAFFYKDKRASDGLSGRCKDCVKISAKESQIKNFDHRKKYLKEYSKTNKDRLLTNRRKYREDNKEYFTDYMRNYHVNRRKDDLLFRVKHNVRNRLWHAFKNSNWKKEGSQKLLGAKYEIVIDYIESLFLENMSWDNYGRCVDGDCDNFWHIDHIIPLNIACTKEELEKLCHYTNLQPLWAIDNLSKSKT